MTGRRRRRKGKAVSGRLLHVIKASHPFLALVYRGRKNGLYVVLVKFANALARLVCPNLLG